MLVSDPKELDKIREREFDITKERIQKILSAGANVILTTKGIDDMSLKYFVEAGAIACRRVPKEDLRCALGSALQQLFEMQHRQLVHGLGCSDLQQAV